MLVGRELDVCGRTPAAAHPAAAAPGAGAGGAPDDVLGTLELLISGRQPDKALLRELRDALVLGAAAAARPPGAGAAGAAPASPASDAPRLAAAAPLPSVSPPGTPNRGCSCDGAVTAVSEDGAPLAPR
ncbi:MAG: hypothetical protein J3K34DRAFT_526066, partial [Monoraphidium minutum]